VLALLTTAIFGWKTGIVTVLEKVELEKTPDVKVTDA